METKDYTWIIDGLVVQTVCVWMLKGYPLNVFHGKRLHLDAGIIKNGQGQEVKQEQVLWVRPVGTGVVQCYKNFPLEEVDENTVLYYADEAVMGYLRNILAAD